MQRDLAGLAAGAGVGDGFADAEVFAHGAVAVARSEVDPDVVGSDAGQANGGFRVDLPGAGLADDEVRAAFHAGGVAHRSEEHTSELQSLVRISYAVLCLKKKTQKKNRQ